MNLTKTLSLSVYLGYNFQQSDFKIPDHAKNVKKGTFFQVTIILCFSAASNAEIHVIDWYM